MSWRRAIGAILTFATIDLVAAVFFHVEVAPLVIGSIVISIRVLRSVEFGWHHRQSNRDAKPTSEPDNR